ncbi:MAG TPA: Nif3-like dinuclear metal center hexameric protein [Saprospiraceae bacterium]|nr:Nif3-like dinuclear metal center hexameric protein [Saprospiraceae bacterium]HMQ84115.1 Nif3-like dinuclear metal center hexameric protein [Saprospiraceae bacterium]
MQIKDVITYLENIAPPVYQEAYDNTGLIVGDPHSALTGVMICLDSTEAVIEEALVKNCNLIIAHHPIVFSGLKKLTGRHYVERVVIQAIRHNLAIYAIHTNLDNVYQQGVNGKMAEKLGLVNTRILHPKAGIIKKLAAYVQPEQSEALRQALFEAGANLPNDPDKRSFASLGVATIPGQSGAQMKIEVLFSQAQERTIQQTLEAFGCIYEWHDLKNTHPRIGAGLVGELPKAMEETTFLKLLKKNFAVGCLKHTRLLGKPIQKVALCGGAGGFLLKQAKQAQADIFITSDYKYHDFFEADGQIVIADIGHFESEQFTIGLLYEIISQKFTNFAAYCTEVNTNPVQYI